VHPNSQDERLGGLLLLEKSNCGVELKQLVFVGLSAERLLGKSILTCVDLTGVPLGGLGQVAFYRRFASGPTAVEWITRRLQMLNRP